MNNPVDNTDQDHDRNLRLNENHGMYPDSAIGGSAASREESAADSGNVSRQESVYAGSLPDNAPGISQFLKVEVEAQSTEPDAVNAASVVQGIGHMLRNERLARKMSIEDISRQLRISAVQVEAIEKEDFDALPGRTFLRGFVRNYANLMHLDANAVLKMLPGPAAVVTRVEHTPFKIQEMQSSSRESRIGGGWLQIMLVLAALAGIGYFMFHKMPLWNKAEEKVNDQDFVVQQESGSGTIEMQLALPSLNLSTGQGNTMQLNRGTDVPTSVVAQNPVNNLNTIGTLVFDFTADTHVRVIDGNDDIIFEQTSIRGTQHRVSGKRPLSVEISKASAVTVNYNDRSIDIKPYTHPTKGSANLMLE